ncbi:MAG: clostripain-related cysteine peptidase [candidate division WOR-3 bacterium]|nr:clostripain-related cysteine peptidase [candidate division WOR-3 bacterium]
MKRTILFVLMLVLMLTLSAKEWTIMVYICADNNLVGAVNGDIDEIETAFTDDTDIDFIVQVDGMRYNSTNRGYHDIDNSNITGTRRYCLSPTGNATSGKIDVSAVQDMGEVNMADPNVLIDFVDWAVTNYPANNYGLIIWNHGSGWMKNSDGDLIAEVYSPMTGGTGEYVTVSSNNRGGVSDDTSEDMMSSSDTDSEWRAAMDGIRGVLGGNKLRFLGHDMCVMAYMETIWDERFVTEMIVASEANIAYYGWPYNSWITNLINNPNATNDQIGTWMVDDYASDYSGSDATLCYIDLLDGDMESLRDNVQDLSYSLVNNDGGRDDATVNACISNTMSMSSGTFWEDYRDLYLFCDELRSASVSNATKQAASAVQNDINSLVEYSWAGGSFNGSYGLGIYLPTASVYWFPGGDDAGADTMAYEWSPWGGGYGYNGTYTGCEYWTFFIYGLTNTEIDNFTFDPMNNPDENIQIDITAPSISYTQNYIITRNVKNVDVYDIAGKMISINEVKTKQTNRYDISDFKPGIYFAKGDNIIRKIVKIK